MLTRKPTTRDLSHENYRRECTLRNSAFREDRKHFLARWESESDLFVDAIVVARKAQRGQGLEAMKEQQLKQRRYNAEMIELCHKWPSITPSDISGAATGEPGPKVRLAPFSPTSWPRDGSILLCVDKTTTGDEIKRQWQSIKRGLHLNERRVRGSQQNLKLRIFDMYYEDNKTLGRIASVLGKPIQTVYRLLIAVCREIGKVRDKSRADPSFDEKAHWGDCSLCQKGTLCSLAETKLGLKQPAIKAKIRPDIDSLPAEFPKGRKPRLKVEF